MVVARLDTTRTTVDRVVVVVVRHLLTAATVALAGVVVEAPRAVDWAETAALVAVAVPVSPVALVALVATVAVAVALPVALVALAVPQQSSLFIDRIPNALRTPQK